MEISYRKDGNQNIMIIKGIDIDENDYKLQMVINNKISGIVPMEIAWVNNKKEIYYDITSKVSLANLYARRQMSGKEIYSFIQEIKSLAESMKEYLLDIGSIILDFEMIYFNRQNGKYEFCYFPNDAGELHESVRKMFDRMLEYIDHDDKEAVLIAYGIQQIVINDDFTISDIMSCVYQSIQEYKKEKEVKEKEFQEEKMMKEEITLINSQKEVGMKEGILSHLFHIFKKKTMYLDEEGLKAEFLSEENSGYYESETENSSGKLKGEFSDRCLQYSIEAGETMILEPMETSRSIVLKSNIKEDDVIMPNKFPYIVGKSKRSCDFAVDSPVVSRVHMRLLETSNEYYVEDLNSTNGTFVNGNLLVPHKPAVIHVGDRITLANVDFIVE